MSFKSLQFFEIRLPWRGALVFFWLSLLVTPVVADSLPFPVGSAEKINVASERILDAQIEAIKQATISAQITERVEEINFDVDDYVEKGAILLRFRDKKQRADYDVAVARFQEAKAEFDRVKEVFERKLVSKSAFDKAEAELKAARGRLEQAREALQHTVLRAPYNGIVVKRHIEVGETARVGQELMTGISLESLRATTHAPQSLIANIRMNGKARVILKDGVSVPAQSLVISPFADVATHTFQVRVNLEAGQANIYPGMWVKVAFQTGEETRLVIPKRAVAYRSEVTAVYVVTDSKVTMRYVRLGIPADEERITVLAGLRDGEQIALDPVSAAAYVVEQRRSEANE